MLLDNYQVNASNMILTGEKLQENIGKMLDGVILLKDIKVVYLLQKLKKEKS